MKIENIFRIEQQIQSDNWTILFGSSCESDVYYSCPVLSCANQFIEIRFCWDYRYKKLILSHIVADDINNRCWLIPCIKINDNQLSWQGWDIVDTLSEFSRNKQDNFTYAWSILKQNWNILPIELLTWPNLDLNILKLTLEKLQLW